MLESLAGYSQQMETVLEAYLSPDLNHEQVNALFDIVPGLDTCHYDRTIGMYLLNVIIITITIAQHHIAIQAI